MVTDSRSMMASLEVKVEMIVVTDILSKGDSLLFDPRFAGNHTGFVFKIQDISQSLFFMCGLFIRIYTYKHICDIHIYIYIHMGNSVTIPHPNIDQKWITHLKNPDKR